MCYLEWTIVLCSQRACGGGQHQMLVKVQSDFRIDSGGVTSDHSKSETVHNISYRYHYI